ncbi:MAG: Geranylgeranyl diphosphate synthase [Candidatus Erwinia impunctatus]|nr:Geranylgeranyl diphosphate synthase [Culicoides impunctatus]
MTDHAAIDRDQEDRLFLLRNALEQRLLQLLPAYGEENRISQAMSDATLTQGKRIRPLLLLLTAQDLAKGTLPSGSLELACAIEFVHAASLMLDDLPCMDNAQLRRGQPTIHCQYGQDVTLLAAVALLSLAFSVIANTDKLSAQQRTLAVSELAKSIGSQGLVMGQYQDLSAGKTERSSEAINQTNALKTSTLFDAAFQLAAIAADASSDQQQALHTIALELGQAFQLLDDLSDGAPDSGKEQNKDQGKSTLVNLLGHASARQQLLSHLQRADAQFSLVSNEYQLTQHFISFWFHQRLASLD